MPVPFGDLARETAELGAALHDTVSRVLTRGWFVLGPELESFEETFAQLCGVRHAVGCGNGTDAITLALRALGLGGGDEVITVANTCVPTAAGIRAAGCTIRLVDCDARTLQMDVPALETAITSRTRAVVPVYLYGSAPDMRSIAEICDRKRVALVGDCAQAHGTSFHGVGAAQYGQLSTWSFYPSKNLGAYGDGGAVLTDDPALATRLRMLRNYGQSRRYHHDVEGSNSRLDELQAAILSLKLPKLELWNERRRTIAAMYGDALGEVVQIPPLEPGTTSSRHLFPIRVPSARRDAIRDSLGAAGIGTQIHYPIPLHRQRAYADSFANLSFQNAEAAAGELISLPLFPQLRDEEVHAVIDAVREHAR